MIANIKEMPLIVSSEKERLLSIYLTYRGFGFTLFEDAKTVVDWGHVDVTGHDPEIFRKRIKSLIENGQVDSVISYSGYKRPLPIKNNIKSLPSICKSENVNCKVISKEEVSSVFESFGSYTKYQRAGLVASYLPDLAYKLPSARKPWQSEDLRLSIFDSACLAICYFYMK